MELKNGIGILAVLAIVGVWYIFYYGAYAKERSVYYQLPLSLLLCFYSVVFIVLFDSIYLCTIARTTILPVLPKTAKFSVLIKNVDQYV